MAEDITLSPQYNVTIVPISGGTPSAGFTVVAGISRTAAPMSDADVKIAYENNPDTNAFTDAEQAKLIIAAVLGGAGIIVGSTHFNVQVGTSYTLVADDNGKTITLDNVGAIAVTVPAGLGQGFRCTLIQIGTGQVSILTSGTTLNSLSGFNKIAGQHGVGGLLASVANIFALAGDLAA